MLNREELLAAIRIKPLLIKTCSMCKYPCCFEFRGEQFGYDAGCDCVTYDGWEPRTPEALDFYLDPAHGWIDKLTKFAEENTHVKA